MALLRGLKAVEAMSNRSAQVIPTLMEARRTARYCGYP